MIKFSWKQQGDFIAFLCTKIIAISVGKMDEDVSHYLLYNFFAFDATKNLLRRYAEKCYEVIKTRAVKKKEEVYAVRKVYSLFSGEKEHMCGEIFQGVFERIKEYQEDVMKSYRKTK